MYTLRFTALFALLNVALSVPTECGSGGIPGGFQVCTDRDFGGVCAWEGPSDTCWYFLQDAHSIRPDVGGYCRIYDDNECTIQSSNVLLDGENKKLKIECPGSGNVDIPFGSKHMKCFVNE